MHPFHPWHGRRVEVLDHRNILGVERVLLAAADGRQRWIPAAWTDLAPSDVFLAVSAGRSSFRADDLLRLSDLIAEAKA